MTTPLETHIRDLRQRLEELHQLRRDLDRQTFATRRRTYRVEEDRQADLAKVRREGDERLERMLTSAQESLRFARELVQEHRVNAPPASVPRSALVR